METFTFYFTISVLSTVLEEILMSQTVCNQKPNISHYHCFIKLFYVILFHIILT